MRNGEGESSRWRKAILALTFILLAASIGEALVPPDTEAKPKRDRGVHAQIVGGEPAPQGKFMFMAAVIEDDFFICGGTLIDPSFVLTAAHCVTDLSGEPLAADDFAVAVGKANLEDLDSENFRDVVDVIVPLEWNPTVSSENDVALLELDEPIPAAIAQPIPLVQSGQTSLDSAGREAVIAGWGETENADFSDQLLEAPLRLLSGGTCGDIYGAEFQSEVMLCAGLPGRDACFGDSGGPLIVKEQIGTKKKRKKGKKHKNKKKKAPIFRDVQAGIVSFGSETCDTAGVYTRVSAPGINDFIVDVVQSQ